MATQPQSMSRYGRGPAPDSLGDILERVLDRGVVIAGDIVVSVVNIELLTLKVRLLIASVDTAQRMGIDWWTRDPFLNSRARTQELESENSKLQARLEALEKRLESSELKRLESLEERTYPSKKPTHKDGP